MKARVKATGEIVEVINIDYDALVCTNGDYYTLEEIEGLECDPDYWTRLEHQAAIAAMQGFMVNGMGDNYENIAKFSIEQAHALVEKLKEKEEGNEI